MFGYLAYFNFWSVKHRYPLSISCSKIFDSCKIKRMITNLTQLGYVNNYDKNRYLEKFSKAAVEVYNSYSKCPITYGSPLVVKMGEIWGLNQNDKNG